MTQHHGTSGAGEAKLRRPPQPLGATTLGAGTVGLGQAARPSDPAKVAYVEWCRRKAGAESSNAESVKYSPREFNKLLLANVDQSRRELEEQRRRIVVETQAENKSLLARARKEQAELVKLRVEHVRGVRRRDEEAHDEALETFAAGRATALTETKLKMREERQSWQEMAAAEKEERQRAIAASKQAWKEAHERALEERRAQQQQRLELIKESKVRDRERLRSWRNESNEYAQSTANDTQHKRRELRQGLCHSKEEHAERRHAEVAATKAELDNVQAERERRRKAQEEAVRIETAATKAAQASSFADRVAEIAEQRRKAAQELRDRSAADRIKREQEQQRRNQDVAERRDHVRNANRSRNRSESP